MTKAKTIETQVQLANATNLADRMGDLCETIKGRLDNTGDNETWCEYRALLSDALDAEATATMEAFDASLTMPADAPMGLHRNPRHRTRSPMDAILALMTDATVGKPGAWHKWALAPAKTDDTIDRPWDASDSAGTDASATGCRFCEAIASRPTMLTCRRGHRRAPTFQRTIRPMIGAAWVDGHLTA